MLRLALEASCEKEAVSQCVQSQSIYPLTVNQQLFPMLTHLQVDLILPTDVYDLISQSLLSCPSLTAPPTYRRLVMPLSAILEPAFFNNYIKSGNILLLSRGRLDVENIICLSDGVLRMSLDTETYERAGLQGQPAKFGNGPGVMKRRRFGESSYCELHSSPRNRILTRGGDVQW
jgi:hypothetical protein